MTGILSVGGHVPRYRLLGKALAKVVIHRPVWVQLAGGMPLPHYGS